jgi:hypothetical protein
MSAGTGTTSRPLAAIARSSRELKGDVSGEEVCTAAPWLVRVRPGQRPASRRTQTTSCLPLAPRNLPHPRLAAWYRAASLQRQEALTTVLRDVPGCRSHSSRSSDLGRA